MSASRPAPVPRAWAFVVLLLTAPDSACSPAAQAAPPASSSASSAKATAYPAMAPIGQYRMASRQDEIALARSAAPASISVDAEVLVLADRDYELAAEGKNGFVCLVQRSWVDSLDNPEFWNPRVRSPNCFNAPAARSVLAPYLKLTAWVLAGVSRDDLRGRTRAALEDHSFSAPEPGSMSFMMSPRAYLSDDNGHWLPHLMFWGPRTSASSWGANLPGSPIMADEGSDLDPGTVFFVAVRRWSDGSPAPNP